jgi:hypothetical protein
MVGASMPQGPEPGAAKPISTDQIRRRVRLMVQISARPGVYRRGLVKTAERLTPQEAVVLADLEHHGLDVVQLQDVLRGAHVLIDDPSLYQRWQFPGLSHQRISSHHHEIDKHKYPDYGMRGPVLREELHGRLVHGTWVQLEKTPVAPGKRPSWIDVVHLADYVIYKATRSNVGPWGRSVDTEKRPLYLSPDLRARVPLPKAASDELTRVVSRLEEDEDATSASPGLASRFPPPERAGDLSELTFTGEVQGRGLFGSSNVWITRMAARTAKELLRRDVEPPGWAPPPVASGRSKTVELDGGPPIRYAARIEGDPSQEEHR